MTTDVVEQAARLPRSLPRPLGRIETWRQAWLGMDRNASMLGFVSTPLGIIAVHVAFMIAMVATVQVSPLAAGLITATLAGCAVLPRHRLLIVTFASLAYFLVRPFRTHWLIEMTAKLSAEVPGGVNPLVLQISLCVVFLAAVYGWLTFQQRSNGLISRRPLLVQLWAFGAFIVIGSYIPTGTWAFAIFWVFTAIWASSFWVLAYMMADLKAKNATPNIMRVGYMRPVWGGSATPIGKGHAYLSKFEAKDDKALAATRLKAVKLMVWAAILDVMRLVLEQFIHGTLGIPTLHQAIAADMAGQAHGVAINWSALIIDYFLDLILIAYWGHVIVAIVRMLGYAIPRNTVNPLASRTLAEFWNRYFFYFKELLVDFFFYPAFMRWFKKWPKLRTAFATFSAACFGNFLYHAMSEVHFFALLDPLTAFTNLSTFAFYSFGLAIGLIVSQLRGRRPRPEDGFWRYEVVPRVNVMMFFILLKVFDDIYGSGTLVDRFAFFFSLFGA
ncbi:MAG: hypothetical protein WBF87_09115 [Mesorhizobium sp.]